jgi:hypothetical protein
MGGKNKFMLNTIKNSDMKKALKLFLIAGIFMSLPMLSLAQNPPHPNGGSGPTGGNTPVGGGAPIDGGLSILIALGAAYGGRKIYQMKKD